MADAHFTLHPNARTSIGGGAGPGRYAAWAFARNGFAPFHPQVSFVRGSVLKRFPCPSRRANVVIGDIFERGAEGIVNAIKKLPSGSGKACWKKCDVTNWEDQVALFELAMGRFGGVDIVVSAPLLQWRVVGWH